MKKEERPPNLKIPMSYFAVPAAMLVLLVLLGIHTWTVYRNTLMDNQKEQLLLVSQALGQNMEASLSEYGDTLSFLCRVEEEGNGNDAFYEEFFSEQDIYDDLRWEDEEGNVIKSVRGCKLSYEIQLAQPGPNTTFWQCREPDDSIHLAIRRKLNNGTTLVLVIDEETYYEELISGIHVGTNGYIVIKDSKGLLIMHPSKKQWGIDVIEGRMKLFPGLDYNSLSEMIDHQIRDESGIYEYESYWWTDPDVPRVRKVAAHTHVSLGEDFWIVSAVVDYTDFYTPIAAGFRSIIMVFMGVLVVFLTLAVLIGKLVLEQKRATSEIEYLRELNETLEELHRSEESIAHQQRLQVMGAMTGGIAHEFNNFLTPIMGHADLLMAEMEEDSDAYDSAHEIYEASEKAQEIVRQISALSRKNVETVYRSVEAAPMLKRNIKLIDTILPSQVKMREDIQLKEECFLGNATQIHQVLLNLFTNAIHAIGQEAGTITFRAREADREEVVRRYTNETVSGDWKRYIHLSVEDTGCGMDSSTLRHIFEPFYTTKKNGEGTGLGLPLADQIIHAHHGYLSAESVVGKGSIFHIYLPLLEPGADSEPLQWGQSRQLKIVVADDNMKILELLHRQFSKLKMEIRTCTKKDDILALLHEEPADVLAIDESLEDGDGIEFCMSIQGRYPSLLKLVMIDTVTREVVEAKSRKIIDGYVDKPVSDTTLLKAIYNCLEGK